MAALDCVVSIFGVNIDFTDKLLIDFDIVSFYTNVNIEGAIRAIRVAVQQIHSDKIPLNKRDYSELIEKCMKFGFFTFNIREYHQHEGLPMGSPLSAVSAFLHIEILEKEHISHTIPYDSKWFRYIDNCLCITQKKTDIHDLQRKLNNIDDKIQFTIEEENNGQLPFMDTVIIRLGNITKFKVFRKPTNKDDYIHFFLAPMTTVENSGFYRTLSRILRPLGLVVVNDTGKKIGHLARKNTEPHNDASIIYKIPCSGCDNAYFGEYYRGLTNRLKEHKADIRHHREINALVYHVDTEGYQILRNP
ncbi:uncharacterized protein LOC143027434 [Oratosquilla oratoria]|uniref:uncharacterized protein LOC143027434 n=1 Tax=Oratosquilla oratoria TaxID=337810 RepID=UPI003F75882A